MAQRQLLTDEERTALRGIRADPDTLARPAKTMEQARAFRVQGKDGTS